MQTQADQKDQKYHLLYKMGKFLSATAERIVAFNRKAEAIPGGIPETAVMLFYAAAHLGMAVVHEPFFDEAEAWQIARCVSIKTLLFETTHYEGHPPLWHLILMPLAKAGAPYELSLTLVSLIFAGGAVFLILRYAPFPRIVRLLLPFTYFYFYQYGVISRVYCVMLLEFALLSMVYQARNEKPGRYVLVLILLCITSAYGIVIAGGLALVWLWEIWDRQGIRGLIGGYIRDRRIWWLAALLMTAVCVILQIMPREDTYAAALKDYEVVSNSFIVRLVYMLLVLPADVTLTDVYCDYTYLYKAIMPSSTLVSGGIVGVMIWSLILYYGKRKRTVLLCALPYTLFAVFGAAVYISFHHIGIGLIYLCFWAWVSAEAGEVEEIEQLGGSEEPEVRERPENRAGILKAYSEKMKEPVRCGAVLLGTLAMGISIFWTAASCVLDIDRTYAAGRNEAKFIKEHHLDRYRIMAGWMVTRDAAGNSVNEDINLCDQAVNVAPYFEHNIFFNFNQGRDDRSYITHMRLTKEETQAVYDTWREEEAPQVLWMYPDLAAAYGDTIAGQDYVPVYREPVERVWKAGTDYSTCDIYLQRDLLAETGLSVLKAE